MKAPTADAVARGESLVQWLASVHVLLTPDDIAEYLQRRVVARFRVDIYPGVVIWHLPRGKGYVVNDVRNFRPPAVTWVVAELPWWRRGRRIWRAPASTAVLG